MFTLKIIRFCSPKLNVSARNFVFIQKSKHLGVVSHFSGQGPCCCHRQLSNMCDMTQLNPKDRLVWMDMEMTGLDITKDHILEIACIVTDENLNTIAEGPDLTIHQSDHVLNSMNEWCIKHHGESGLTAASRMSKVSLEEAETQIVEFLKLHTPPGTCPLAGNSVYMDRLFLRIHMPRVDSHLHYRIIDVSTVKELCRRWCPEKYSKAPPKVYGHRALMDIHESIQELHYYHMAVFKGQSLS